MKYKTVMIMASIVALGGCRMMEAQKQMDASQEAYKQCLLDNPRKPSNCESLRLIYETNKEKWEGIHKSLQPIGTASPNNTTILNSPEQPSTWMMNQGNKTYLCNNIGGVVNCN